MDDETLGAETMRLIVAGRADVGALAFTVGVVTTDPLAALVDLPGVADAVEAARVACVELRGHEAFRHNGQAVRTRAGQRALVASLALDGVKVAPDVVARAWGDEGAAWAGDAPLTADVALIRGGLRAAQVLEQAMPGPWDRRRAMTPLPQLMARLHQVLVADVAGAEPGVVRTAGQTVVDLRSLGAPPAAEAAAARVDLLLRTVRESAAPALVVAAVLHAELMIVRPFAIGSGQVARAMARWLTVTRGLEPTGCLAPEGVWAAAPALYLSRIAGASTGEPGAMGAWLVSYAEAVVAAASVAVGDADAVLAGVTGSPER